MKNSKRAKQTAYWIATGLFCASMAFGGVANVFRFEEQATALKTLGYPSYLLPFLGVCKLLGVVALLLPRTALLKEWAYAGFAFDLLGAGYSHLVMQDQEILPPFILLAIGIASYLLRPDERRVPRIDAGGQPCR